MKNVSRTHIIPAYGQVQPVSPAFFFDFHDAVRNGGAPTVLQERSGSYFAGHTSRGSLNLSGAVGTQWDNDAGTFDFNSATPHFFAEDVDIKAGDYADVLSPTNIGVLLLWWRVEIDATNANYSIITFGGMNNGVYGLMVQYGGAAVQRHRIQISDGNGVGAFVNEDIPSVAYATGTKYNLALAIDATNRTYQWWRNGTPGAQDSLDANQTLEDNDSDPVAGRQFVLGSDLNNGDSGVVSPFDGHLQRVGGINFAAGAAPSNLDAIVKRLHARNCIPGWEFHGI